MRTHLLALLFGLFVVAFAASPASADPRADAKAHYVKGKSLFDAKDYVNAIAEFKAADQLAPSAVNDYNIALAYDALGDATQATTYYNSYLTRMPDATNKTEVQASLKRLQASQAQADADQQRRAEEEARRVEEERRLAEEQRKMQPPDGTGGGTTSSTGDPELDRVAGVDVNAVRDQRGLQPAGGAVAAAGGGPAQPPQGGGAPPPAEQPKKAKPIYKQWWFWVVAGVSAYVLISILASDSSSSQPGAIEDLARPLPPMPSGFSASSGTSILSF